MGYLFALIALLCGVAKGYCGKKTGGYVEAYTDAMLVNTLRMVFCVAIGFLLLAVQGDLSLLRVGLPTLGIAVLSGVATAVFVVSWLLSVRRGAYMMLDVFLMLGVLVTLLCSLAVYREPVRPVQWLGFGMLLIAVAIMCSYNDSIKGKMTASSLGLLLLCGLSNGIADFSQKMFVRQIGGSAAVFNFYTYIVAGVVLGVVWCVCRRAPRGAPAAEHTTKNVLRRVIWYVLIMAVSLFANSFFKTLAAARLSAVQLYPLIQGCTLILSAVMAATLFKERLTGKCVVGLCLAFAALLVINVL